MTLYILFHTENHTRTSPSGDDVHFAHDYVLGIFSSIQEAKSAGYLWLGAHSESPKEWKEKYLEDVMVISNEDDYYEEFSISSYQLNELEDF